MEVLWVRGGVTGERTGGLTGELTGERTSRVTGGITGERTDHTGSLIK